MQKPIHRRSANNTNHAGVSVRLYCAGFSWVMKALTGELMHKYLRGTYTEAVHKGW